MNTPENLFSKIERSLVAGGDRMALHCAGEGSQFTFRDILGAAGRYANALEALGVEPGDRVMAQIEKSTANLFLYLGAIKAGAVYQPLNPAYTEAEVAYFVQDAEPKVIVCDPGRQQAMRKLGDRHGVLAVVNLDAGGHGSLADLASRMAESHETVSREKDDLASLIYTSGTTGRSKGAMITHGNLSSNAAALAELLRFTRDDVLLHALPIFHVHGLFIALNTALISGSSLLWHNKFDVQAVMEGLSSSTVMMGVPTFYTRLLSQAGFDRGLCRNMRLFMSGSAPLLVETHEAFRKRTGQAILERYGMTETNVITANPYEGERIAGTVGFALPGVSVRIAGDQPGVIEVKGPNVFKGYWRMAEKTAEEFTADGYFKTGDIGVMDQEGRVSIVGRAKDLIISGGFNVYPKEVEEAIDALPGVIESAVIGVPHPDFGEGVIAAITAKENAGSEAEMITKLSTRLAKFKLPKRIFVINELPRNAMGKVQKSLLREKFAGTFNSPQL